MKKKFYVIIPVIAFSLILTNAFFGHLIYESPYDQDINKYSIYVHLEEQWKSYPGNILFDITTVWSNPNSSPDPHQIYYDPSLDIQEFKDYNFNELQFIREKPFVELKHEFSDCDESWKPMLYRYAIDTIRTQFQYLQGLELSGDPYAAIFPSIINIEYDHKELNSKLESGYVQFIPICTSKQITSYEYSVKINDDKNGFDVYFIPSENEIEKYIQDENSFDFYKEEGCYGKNFQSFNGFCKNVGKNSGLLISIPDNLNLALTKIIVNLHEIN